MSSKKTSPPRINTELQLVQQILGLPTFTACKPLNPSYENAVFISIDCEALENAQHIITEIGVSVLDSLDVKSIVEGREQHWLRHIRSEHYRPIEHRKLVNRRYVRGCPEDFNCGHSTWVRSTDFPRLLTRILRDPTRLSQAADFDQDISDARRNVVIVGHGVAGDMTYLKKLGFSPQEAVTAALNTIDTQRVSRPTKRTPPSLNRLLHSLNMSPVNLHNAGNDAKYTLEALVLMALRDHEQPGVVITNLLAVKKLPSDSYVSRMTPHIYGGTLKDRDKIDKYGDQSDGMVQATTANTSGGENAGSGVASSGATEALLTSPNLEPPSGPKSLATTDVSTK